MRGADFALSRSLRGMKLTLQAAAATKSAVDAELEALQAFGTRQYAARALQVTPYPNPENEPCRNCRPNPTPQPATLFLNTGFACTWFGISAAV